MLKKSVFIVSLLIVESAMFGADATIRVVHGQRVIGMLKESKDLEDELLKERKKWEDKVRELAEKLKGKATEFDAKAKAATPDALTKIKEEIEKLKREGKNIEQEAEAILKGKFETGLAKINKKVKEKIDKLAQKNDWDIVAMQEAGIVYVSKRADVTQLIIDEMNAAYGKDGKKTMPKTK